MQKKLCFFNGHWNIYLYTKDGSYSWGNTFEQKTKLTPEGDGEFRLRRYTDTVLPIYSFGIFYNDRNKRPGHDGEWSSNSSAINKVFGTDLYEVALDQISVAVPMEWLKEQLGDSVTWSPDDIYREYITSVKGHENEYGKWIELI